MHCSKEYKRLLCQVRGRPRARDNRQLKRRSTRVVARYALFERDDLLSPSALIAMGI